MAHKLLIVDDEKDILDLIEICLTHEGYEIIRATDGIDALAKCDATVDLILLDVMMPKLDGIKTCIEIRKKYTTPIIFLTAKTQDTDLILGLQVGADDYMTKPFTPAVLSAKVRATLRRAMIHTQSSNQPLELLRVQDLIVDEKAVKVTKSGQVINLTKTEYDILVLLMKNKGQVFSIQKLYESIWRETYFNDSSNTVMVHIKRLRNKIDEKESINPIIKTVWGLGYKIE